MTDVELLERVIKERGLKYSFLAKELNLSSYGFYCKRKGLNEFTAPEIVKLSELLELTNSLRDQIFLSNLSLNKGQAVREA